MTNSQMVRLTENIARDGCLTSFPLVYRADKEKNPDFYKQAQDNLVVISGNHRVQAAKQANLEKCHAILIEGFVPDERLRSIQLSHNAISGQDDPAILKGLYDSLDLDEKLYSGLTDDDFGVDSIDVSSLSIGVVKYVDLNLAFLPDELAEVTGFIDTLEKQGRKDPTLVARYEDFDRFFDTVVRTKIGEKVTNNAIAIGLMAKLAAERLDQIQKEDG